MSTITTMSVSNRIASFVLSKIDRFHLSADFLNPVRMRETLTCPGHLVAFALEGFPKNNALFYCFYKSYMRGMYWYKRSIRHLLPIRLTSTMNDTIVDVGKKTYAYCQAVM